MKKALSLVLCLAVTIILAVPVVAGAEGVTNLTVLRPGDEQKVASFMEPAIEKFNAENPDINVKIIYDSWGGWIQTYPTMFESDTQPDVIFWWDNKQKDSSVDGKLVDLRDYVDASVFEELPESAWALASIGGDEIYYIPSSIDAFVLYYNKDVFEAAGLDPDAPPTTWDELKTACEAIVGNTDVPALGIPAMTGMEVLEEFMAQFITQSTLQPMLDSESQPLFNSPEGLAALEYLQSILPYTEPTPTDYGRGELRALLRDGKIGMIIDSAWAVTTFQAAYGENLDDSVIGVAAPPLAPNGEMATWAGTNGWIATRQDKAEACGRLISYLMSEEVLYAHHKAYGSIPITEYELSQDFYQHQYWKTMSDVVTSYKLFGMIGRNSSTPAAFYSGLEEVWQLFVLGDIDAQTTLDMAVEVIGDLNARN